MTSFASREMTEQEMVNTCTAPQMAHLIQVLRQTIKKKDKEIDRLVDMVSQLQRERGELDPPEPQPELKPEHPAINGYNRYDYIPVEGIMQPKPEPKEITMKFETINGQLCRMVEPEPLTDKSQFPCVVRLIQDDSPMGRYNLKLRNTALEPLVVTGIAKDIGVVTHLVPRPHFSCECYELIGYPVADGSLEWALYQIRSGKKVVKEGDGEQYCGSFYKNRLFYLNDYGYLITKNVRGLIDPCSEKEFLDLDKTGWQIYEEPKPETAKGQFKVKDWVEFNPGNNPKQVEIVDIDGDKLYYNTRYAGKTIKTHIYASAITRKLDPSEVNVKVTLEGTVQKDYDNAFILTNTDGTRNRIKWTTIDLDTAKLVRELLDMQGGGE
jgi:hypothetical protein